MGMYRIVGSLALMICTIIEQADSQKSVRRFKKWGYGRVKRGCVADQPFGICNGLNVA